MWQLLEMLFMRVNVYCRNFFVFNYVHVSELYCRDISRNAVHVSEHILQGHYQIWTCISGTLIEMLLMQVNMYCRDINRNAVNASEHVLQGCY